MRLWMKLQVKSLPWNPKRKAHPVTADICSPGTESSGAINWKCTRFSQGSENDPKGNKTNHCEIHPESSPRESLPSWEKTCTQSGHSRWEKRFLPIPVASRLLFSPKFGLKRKAKPLEKHFWMSWTKKRDSVKNEDSFINYRTFPLPHSLPWHQQGSRISGLQLTSVRTHTLRRKA